MPSDRLSSTRFPSAVYVASLVVASLVYRAPALMNAATVDSDAAIVGLQARHILKGEWSWFLYGSGYQTSVDSCVAALFFVVLGATPLALMLSTLTGHIVATCLAFTTLARHLPRRAALVAAAPLVLTSAPLHTYILNPPRQAALTLVFAAIYVIDGAGAHRPRSRRLLQHASGAAIASLACFADPYALLFLPATILLGALATFDAIPPDESRRAALPRLVAVLVGAAIGIVPFALLVSSPGSVHGETTLSLVQLRHNAGLLVDPCLPWLLGAVAYVPRALLGYVPYHAVSPIRVVQQAGAALFLAAVASGGLAVAWRRVDWPLRRLGAFGCVVAILTIASFLVSVMVMDLFSSRYLAALVLMSPFALAPLAARFGARSLLLGLCPFLVGAGLSGWVGYGDEVHGFVPVALPGAGAGDEYALRVALRARGVEVAIADYWVSYRLSFLFEEALPVVPIHEREDRYAPYRYAYRRSPRSAYIFDSKRSREGLDAMKKVAFEGEHAWGRPVEELRAGTLTAFVFEKTAELPP